MDEDLIKTIKILGQSNSFSAMLTKYYEEYIEAPKKKEEMLDYISREVKKEVKNVKHFRIKEVEIIDEGETADGFYYRLKYLKSRFQVCFVKLSDIRNIYKNSKNEIEITVDTPNSFERIYYMQTNISNATVEYYNNKFKVKIKFDNFNDFKKFNPENIKGNKIMAIGSW